MAVQRDKAIVSHERDTLATLICQANGWNIGGRLGWEFIIGKTTHDEAICLVWNGEQDSVVTTELVKGATKEVAAAGLKQPFRMYGLSSRVADTASWRFCQIPDEILVQMRSSDDLRA